MNTAIQLQKLSKRFGGVTALDQVTFEIPGGEVHALVGENGAGKSTLMKLLAGIYPPDQGDILLNNRRVRFKSPLDARRHEISIVFQELNLFPHRTIAANIFANREPTTSFGVIRRKDMRRAAETVLSELGLNLSPETKLSHISLAEKQLVEIARALQQQARILILDEPNSALNEAESQRLFEIIRRLRARGITIIYVSHRLEEVFAIADRISVLRDGRYQGTYSTSETTIAQIIAAMIGRAADQSFPGPPALSPSATVTLQVRDLHAPGRFGPVSFLARSGEIVGFAGLEGSGVSELFSALFGLARDRGGLSLKRGILGGEIIIRGQSQKSGSPREAIRHGWALIPESRREQGLMMDWSIARNISSLILEQLLTPLRLISRRSVGDVTDNYIARLGIATDTRNKKVSNLSGGNQQKVLLAKWLATKPSILILNDPTRGVDIGAKFEIYKLCQKLAAEGMTILMSSSEVDEILGLAHRVLVLYKGKLLNEFPRGQITKAQLLHAMGGGRASASPDQDATQPS